MNAAEVLRRVSRIEMELAELRRVVEGDATRGVNAGWLRIAGLMAGVSERGGRMPRRAWIELGTGEPFRYDPRGLGGFFREPGALVLMDGSEVVLTQEGERLAQEYRREHSA